MINIQKIEEINENGFVVINVDDTLVEGLMHEEALFSLQDIRFIVYEAIIFDKRMAEKS